MMVDSVTTKFQNVIQSVDMNDDSMVSWQEFQAMLDYPDVLLVLESVGVDAEAMIDIAEDFFHDDIGRQVTVTLEDLMWLVLNLRGDQQAKVKDVLMLAKRGTKHFLAVSEAMDKLECKADLLLSHLTGTSAVVEFKDDVFGPRGNAMCESPSLFAVPL